VRRPRPFGLPPNRLGLRGGPPCGSTHNSIAHKTAWVKRRGPPGCMTVAARSHEIGVRLGTGLALRPENLRFLSRERGFMVQLRSCTRTASPRPPTWPSHDKQHFSACPQALGVAGAAPLPRPYPMKAATATLTDPGESDIFNVALTTGARNAVLPRRHQTNLTSTAEAVCGDEPSFSRGRYGRELYFAPGESLAAASDG